MAIALNFWQKHRGWVYLAILFVLFIIAELLLA